MEKHYLIVILFITLAVIGGLIIVHLQNKGIVKPVLTQTATGFDFMSGGIIAFFSTLAGGSFIYNTGYPIYAVVYVVGFVGIYILLKKSRRNGTKIVVAMVITYLLMVGIVIYFLSSNEKSKEGMQLLKEQYNSGVIIEETDDVKIVAKTNKKQEGISVKEYNILIRNDFSLREKIHSLHYSILDKNIAVSDFVRTDYKYIKDDVKKDFETGYAAKGGLEFMAWYSKRALVPVYTVVKIEFEGDSKEIEELKICYEMEE